MRTNTKTTDLYDALEAEIMETLIDTGFCPLEDGQPDQVADGILTERDVKVLQYFADRRWDAFRLEAAGTGTWATLAEYSEDGIKLMEIDRNGCIITEARFDTNDRGLAMIAKVLA